MSERTEAKVGDIGTVYFYPTYDNDLVEANFNPSAATLLQLVFRMPGATGLCIRPATAAQKTIGGAAVWGLQYTVLAADVVAWSSTSVGGFHQAAGNVSIEGYLEFSADQKWTGSTVTKDQQGRILRVVPRLAV
jgi:hypothetical protein